MTDDTRGGDDALTGGPVSLAGTNDLFGDAFEMHDLASGGDDQLSGGAGSFLNFLYGDARVMDGSSRGGNDSLIGNGINNTLYGDAFEMHHQARGGDDTLTSSGRSSNLYGDAFSMSDDTRGGDDTLTGSGGFFAASVYGDANTMDGNSRGGNDTLIGAFNAILYGDASTMNGNSRGGDDTLVSGAGTDHMWGDGQVINGIAASPTAPTGAVVTGADTFVFAPGNGGDFIHDFRQSDDDRIDVSAYGFTGLVDMVITSDGANTRIDFDATSSVTLFGFADPSGLQASDFLFG
jgi:serralysin